jgi:hypothetical protein
MMMMMTGLPWAVLAARLFDPIASWSKELLTMNMFDIALLLVQAWDVRNSCKHNGAVLPLPSAPEGRGADGVDAMA